MGRTNLKASLETKLSQVLGELEAAEKEEAEIRAGLKKLIALRERIAQLKAVVQSAETVLRFEYPEWTPVNVRPTRAGAWKSPFRSGEQGKVALETLREINGWARPREVAEVMLAKIDHDPNDAEEGMCEFRQAGDLLVTNRKCSAMVLQVPVDENLSNGLPVARYGVLAIGSHALPEETLELLQRGNPAHIINGPSAEELVELLLSD